MTFPSDRAALIALADNPTDQATLDAVCCHLLGPDPALARLRRSLCETAQALDILDRRVLSLANGEYPNRPRGEVTRARALLQETAR